MVRETFQRAAIVLMGVPAARRLLIRAMSSDDSYSGRPPNLPRARAASRPAADRSRIKLRSNSSNAANKWKISCPVELDLFIVIFSCRL